MNDKTVTANTVTDSEQSALLTGLKDIAEKSGLDISEELHKINEKLQSCRS